MATTTLRRCVPQAWRILARQAAKPVVPRRCYSQLVAPRLPIELAAFRDRFAFKEQARGFSTKGDEDIRPPMNIPTLPGKYASILYTEAAKQGILDQVETEMKEIGHATTASPQFRNFIKDISIPKHVQLKMINDAFAKTNFSELTKQFLAGVTKNGRLQFLRGMAECFEELMKAKRGHVTAVVTSVVELSPEELERLKSEYISTMVNPGETIFIEQKINEDILGGVLIEVRGKRLDLSIERRIRDIEKILLQAC